MSRCPRRVDAASERDDEQDGDPEDRRHLRPDGERRGAAGQPGRAAAGVEQESDGGDEERRDDEVVLGRRRLERDHRERGDEQCAEERLAAGEPEPSRDTDDPDRERDERGRLDERDVAVCATEHHRREHAHLAVGRIRVDVRRAVAPRISHRLVLPPDRGTPEVVDDRVEVVLRRRETERNGIAECEEDGDAEQSAERVLERTPERGRAVPEPLGDIAPSAPVDQERDAHNGEPGEERPAGNPPEERQRPQHADELRPRDDVCPEEERGGRPRCQPRGQAQRACRQEDGPGDERQGAGHRPLAEKCW